MPQIEYMKMNDLVKRSGMPRSTIHFYIRQGLLHPAHKTGRTIAYYDESHLERLQTIRKLKKDMRMPVTYLRDNVSKLEMEEKHNRKETSSVVEESFSKDLRERRISDIVNAAIKVFSEKGYHRTRVRDITDVLGISTGTFYIYFSNKRDLFIGVVDHVLRTIIADSAEAIKEEKNLVKRMMIRGQIFYRNYSKYNEILYQLRAEMAGDEQWPQVKVKKIYQALTEPVIHDLKRAVDRGIIRDIDPDLLAYTLTGIVETMSLRMNVDQKYTFDQMMEFLVDLVMNGVALKDVGNLDIGDK